MAEVKSTASWSGHKTVGTSVVTVPSSGTFNVGKLVLGGSGYFRVALGLDGATPADPAGPATPSSNTNEFVFSGLNGIEISVPSGAKAITSFKVIAHATGQELSITGI